MAVLEWKNERLGVSVPQISELEDMWAGEEEVLRQSLCDVEEKVSLFSQPFLSFLSLHLTL